MKKEIPCTIPEYKLVHDSAIKLGFKHGPDLECQLGINIQLNIRDSKSTELLPLRWKKFFEKLNGPYGEVVWKIYQSHRS